MARKATKKQEKREKRSSESDSKGLKAPGPKSDTCENPGPDSDTVQTNTSSQNRATGSKILEKYRADTSGLAADSAVKHAKASQSTLKHTQVDSGSYSYQQPTKQNAKQNAKQTNKQSSKQTNNQDAKQGVGDSISAEAADPPAPPADSREACSRFTSRMHREKRWGPEMSDLRTRLIREAKAGGMAKEEAKLWAYGELERLYPPKDQPPPNPLELEYKGRNNPSPTNSGGKPDDGRIQGLGAIPEDWPTLPANANQQAELAWVQANRLIITEELSTGAIRVHLDRAHSPAPSWAAISWLETSIRSYAKYVDVVSRSLKDEADEAEHIRRERRAIEEIRQLLAEMMED